MFSGVAEIAVTTGKEILSEEAKEAGKEFLKEGLKSAIKETAQEIGEQAGKEALKEVGKGEAAKTAASFILLEGCGLMFTVLSLIFYHIAVSELIYLAD